MASQVYRLRVFTRIPNTIKFEPLREQYAERIKDFDFKSIGRSEHAVVENLATGKFYSVPTWLPEDPQGAQLLAFRLLGIPCVTSAPICSSIHMQTLGKAYRESDEVFHFTGNFDSRLDLFRIKPPLTELDQIHGRSKAANAKREALFTSPEAYRAYLWNQRYYLIHQICEKFNMKVVHIPSQFIHYGLRP